MTIPTDKVHFYNESYKNPHYFRYPKWAYAPYISSLIAFCGLKRGASVLDVGCGQGFFSYLFSKHGMKVHGIDASETGIRTAESLYGGQGITFSVGDIQTATLPERFDCVFVRACSLYNSEAFPALTDVTRSILKHLKSCGTFIFAYGSNFSSKTSATWRYHSLVDMERHFSGYPNAEMFVLNRITNLVLRKYSFTPFATRLNIFFSKVSRMHGELICILGRTS